MSKPKWALLPIVAVIALIVGVALGSRTDPPRPSPAAGTQPSAAHEARTWTCSMHPQIRLDHPGICPICGMNLVPVEMEQAGGTAAAGSGTVVLGPHAQVMARVETAAVTSRLLFHELRTVGKVELDETSVAYLTAWIDGRVDRVFADFPGTVVAKGDHLVSIYSPDLLTTQDELLIALRAERATGSAGGGPITASARRRLELWGIQPEQIQALIERGESLTHLTVYAPIGGTVVEKQVRAGQYVKTGDALYTIADLGRVWVVVEVYERELAWVRFGQPVELALESAPETPLAGAVGFVEPVLTEATRTVRVRVVLKNEGGLLKPGMFVAATIRVPVQPDGTPGPTGLEGKYACPMHPYVVSDASGDCPVCGMPLTKVPGSQGEPTPVLAIPTDAVLTTGRRQLVYVEDAPGVYRQVEPALGPRAGAWYPVLGGLQPGQRVVTRGNFLLDSQAQIRGKPSLLYPEGIVGGGGHSHGGPGMPGHPGTSTEPSGHEGQAPPATGHEGHAPAPSEVTPSAPSPPDGHEGHGGHGGQQGHGGG